jgi:hypothetical protein
VQELIDNIVGFPNRPYDEDPDIMSQALSEEWVPADLEKGAPAEHAKKIAALYPSTR